MTLDQVLDVAGAVAMVLGTFLTFSAAVGLVRFPDLLSRLHAVSKPQSIGLMFVMLGYALSMRDTSVAWTAVLIVLFQLVTAPMGAHIAARSGYRTQQVEPGALLRDEYRRDLAAAMRAERRRQAKERAAARAREAAAAELARMHEEAEAATPPREHESTESSDC